MRYRKGSAADMIILLVLMFVVGLIWIMVSYGSKLLSESTDINPTLKEYSGYAWNGFLGFNSVAILFVVGIALALVVSAFMIKTYPALFLLFFMMNLIALVISFGLSDAWDNVFNSTPQMQSLGNAFNLWAVVMHYLPAIALILGIIFAIAVFIGG